ncbi:helix-turn-helix domain-containing protein [Candidatus Poriferisodalis sp.]|uniref:helix-turn-helix domain-containing protein n=1 Tax=Candidatus Poriferisodalis sp. TaxID=3101277 RepID=UPI003B58F19A
MGHRKFSAIIGTIGPERRARIDAIKEAARADAIAFNLAELRKHRHMTQVDLARRLQRTQATISAIEASEDNLLSTWRAAVEGMGGRLELVAVFDDERIAIPTSLTGTVPSPTRPNPGISEKRGAR